MDGTGSANRPTRSAGGPAASRSSRKPCTIFSISARMALTRFRVNSLISIRRWVLCSGGSMLMKAGLLA